MILQERRWDTGKLIASVPRFLVDHRNMLRSFLGAQLDTQCKPRKHDFVKHQRVINLTNLLHITINFILWKYVWGLKFISGCIININYPFFMKLHDDILKIFEKRRVSLCYLELFVTICTHFSYMPFNQLPLA